MISMPAATPVCHVEEEQTYGPARGLRLTADEQGMLDLLKDHYETHGSEVLRMALRHLFERVTDENTPVPAAA